MHFKLLVLLFATATVVVEEVINCEGSGLCGFVSLGAASVASRISNAITSQINPDQWYNNEDLIYCFYAPAAFETGDIPICAFLQNSGGDFGSVIAELAPYILGS